jgi:predicted aminopeptidase
MAAARLLRPLAAVAALALAASCASPGYYLQAIGGQLEIWREARPIEAVEAAPGDPAGVRSKLLMAREMREFASRELALPPNGSYRKYADLKRPYVAWTVYAAEPFSVRTKAWCFPVAGCVSYRGYFSRESAEAYAGELRDQGYDVYVGGVPAYSTLGWFDDPLLNTFIHYPEAELARLIFHELAHQVAYAADDSEFNESFATTVETVGVERWLARHGTEAQRTAHEASQQRRQDFHALVQKYRGELEALYASGRPPAEMARDKAQTLDRLREEYARIKAERWRGYAGYDRWFGQEINNATLASVGIYTGLIPAFQALLAAQGGDLVRFYAEVKRLAALPKEARDRQLAAFEPGARS